uniref:BTG1 n=1 Tax=Salmo salar TaxID=8030 RepID=B5XDT2_SALSA|nr:BTG1 [Salmo salar]
MHTLCARGTMKPEISAAVGFLSRFLRIKGHVNDRQLQSFSASLQDILSGKTCVSRFVLRFQGYFRL